MNGTHHPPDYCALAIQGFENNTAIISGERQNSPDGKVTWDLDDHSEFNLSSSDPRYQDCLKLARELKQQYNIECLDPGRDRDQIVEYERKIVNALNQKIHEVYGDYNQEVAKALEEHRDSKIVASLHNDSARQNDENSSALIEFEKGQLICRHYAPLMAALCDEAGVKTLYVGGFMNNFTTAPEGVTAVPSYPPQWIKTGGVVPNALNNDDLRHAYLVSRSTGNIIEATAGAVYGAYLSNVNGVSVDDFIAGETIIAARNEGDFTTYGTGNTGQHPDIIKARKEKIAQGDLHKIAAGAANEIPYYTREEASTVYAIFVANCDKEQVTQFYDQQVKPLAAKLSDAMGKGNVAAARKCCEAFPFSKGMLFTQLKTAIANTDLPMAELMMERAPLQGMDYAAISGTLFALPEEQVVKNTPFVAAMVKKLNIKPATHLYLAAKSADKTHIEIALEHIGREAKTPEIKKALVKAQVQLYQNGHNEMADAVKAFTDKEYGDIALPSPAQTTTNIADIFFEQHPLIKGGETVDGEWRAPILPPNTAEKNPDKKATPPR
jgi:hypothetical protein